MTSNTGRHLSADSFARYIASTVPIEHPIPGEPRVVLFVDPQQPRVGLRGPASSNEVPRGGWERLTIRAVHQDGHRMIEVALTDPRLFEDAYPVLCAVADRAQIEGLSMSEAVTETIRRLGHLLEPEGALPHERETGLLGELCLLAGFVQTTDPETAVAAWRGADREEHDFGLARADVEVKTTASERRVHRISSLTQLVPTSGRPLWLVSFQVTVAGSGGTSLAGLVTRIRDQLVDHGLRQSFDRRLREAGWHDRYADTVTRTWRLRSPVSAYAVEGAFPRLTPDVMQSTGVPMTHIDDVTYRIDLVGLAGGMPPTHLADAIASAQKELV